MKFTYYAAILLASVVAAAPAPAADPEANPIADPAAVAEDIAAAAEGAAPLQARDVSYGQCVAACKGGADAMEAICRRLPGITPHALALKAACWGVAAAVNHPAGQKACVAFCDNVL